MKEFFNKKTLLVLGSVILTYGILFGLTTSQTIKPYYTGIIILNNAFFMPATSVHIVLHFLLIIMVHR